MQFLRRSTVIARVVFAWFVLSLGVAIVSPAFASGNVYQLCTSAGTVVSMADGDVGDPSGALHSVMKCPLCVPVAAPPPPAVQPVEPAVARSRAQPHAPAVVRTTQAAAPLPARGPPLLG